MLSLSLPAIQEGKMSFRMTTIAALCLSFASAGCVQTTEPIHTRGRQTATPSAASAKPPVQLLRRHEEALSPWIENQVRASGAFHQGQFVITVHGHRLGPERDRLQALYELDGEPWPTNYPSGMDFYTIGGDLWEVPKDGSSWVNTGAVALLKETGNGFTYSVPLSAMHDPTGPITFAVVAGIPGSYPTRLAFRAFGRAECRQCSEAAVRP